MTAVAEMTNTEDLKLAFKGDKKESNSNLSDLFQDDIPSTVQADDVSAAWNDLVNDIKKNVKFDIEIIDDFAIEEVPEPHQLSKEDTKKTSDALKKLDARFNEGIVRNPIAENAVILVLDAVTKIFEKRASAEYPTIIAGLKDLVDIAMKKDKIMALQKYEVLMASIEEMPPVEIKDTVFGAMVVFHDIFLNDILLF